MARAAPGAGEKRARVSILPPICGHDVGFRSDSPEMAQPGRGMNSPLEFGFPLGRNNIQAGANHPCPLCQRIPNRRGFRTYRPRALSARAPPELRPVPL